MTQIQYTSRQNCTLLAVLCGSNRVAPSRYPFADLVSAGRLDVHKLVNPTFEQFSEAQRTVQPNFLYCQGQRSEDDDAWIGGLVWNGVDASDPEGFSALISPPLPTIIYLEVPSSENIARALHSKGVPYIIFWKNSFSSYAACQFRNALMSVVQSSCSHTWDAFQLALASFRLYCVRNNHVLLEKNHLSDVMPGPHLLGDAPKVYISPAETDSVEEDTLEARPAIQIHDDDVDVRFLVCGLSCALDTPLLSSLEDGLNALLNIEIRGSKLQNRISASPPPLQAATLSHGVVTMRCDITTCSYAHISLLVSGSAQICFDDQLLESHIKSKLIENSGVVCATSNNENAPSLLEPWDSLSIACGASVFEVCLTLPKWAAQVLKQLAPEVTYRSLVALGIASVQGTPVASFERHDAERFLFFCTNQQNAIWNKKLSCFNLPRWSAPLLAKERIIEGFEQKTTNNTNKLSDNGASSARAMYEERKHMFEGPSASSLHLKPRFKVAAMRPIPHAHKRKMHSIISFSDTAVHSTSLIKPAMPASPAVKQTLASGAPISQRKLSTGPAYAQHLIPINPLPMKKHGCDRLPIKICSEDDFLKDVMQFLILRGHTRLVPHGGIDEFPEAVLNAKRLDLYNLYKEVVSRGGFYVGNGINWKGQVFSKMRNHTATNRMTGVGNTLKRHYETYLLEYELAHDDVGGECCLLCHSSDPGDWVNCGLCGEWAHFGCDRRLGLGTFKDYAKTDGLEYICPHCSVANVKKKPQKLTNGYPAAVLRSV